MKTTTIVALGTAVSLGLAACGPPPPEPTPIFPQPIYDKLGDNPQCEEGRTPASVGSNYQDLRCVPVTETCEDPTGASNYPTWCLPPTGQRQPGSGEDDRYEGRQPGSTNGVTGQ